MGGPEVQCQARGQQEGLGWGDEGGGAKPTHAGMVQGPEKSGQLPTQTPLIEPVPIRLVAVLRPAGWHAESWLQLSSPHKTAALPHYWMHT